MRGEQWYGPNTHGFNVWLLEVDQSARVYTVDTVSDLKQLHKSYGGVRDRGDLSYFRFLAAWLDWHAIAQDFDGVHLTERGQALTRFSDPSLYGWDCESTAWFRWVFTDVTYLGRLPFKTPGDFAGPE